MIPNLTEVSREELFELLGKNGTPWVHVPGHSRPGILQSVQRESGNGRTFNCTVLVYPAEYCPSPMSVCVFVSCGGWS